MTGIEFFNDHFGRHFVEPTDDPVEDARRALQSNHPIAEGSPSRFTTGNVAIIRPGNAVLRGRFAVPGVRMTDGKSTELILRALLDWDGEPTMFLEFDKVLFPVDHLFVTYDLRRVRLCGAKKIDEVNFQRVVNPDLKPESLNSAEQRLRRVLKKLQKEAA